MIKNSREEVRVKSCKVENLQSFYSLNNCLKKREASCSYCVAATSVPLLLSRFGGVVGELTVWGLQVSSVKNVP